MNNNFETFLESTGISFFYFKLVLGFVFSFLITYIAIPTIIKISRRKNLMDEPGARSSHLRKIPNLGGIAIFFSLGVCAPIFAYELFDRYKFLFASFIILFFVGVMDDIMVLRAYKKLLAQILVSALMVIGSDVRIRSLFGVFGIYEINYYISIAFSILTFIILINAFNLIDGIDGLAGSYTIVTSALFGVSFFRLGSHNDPLVVLCSILIAASLGFLFYNLSNKRSTKIFMGDTGSMILGFLLAFTGISFIEIFIAKRDEVFYHLQSAPVIAVAILILPIVDTLTVIITRIYHKKSVLSPDKNHIHHKLLNLGLTHRRSTAYIIAYYLLIIVAAYFFRHLSVNQLLVLIMVLGFFGAYLPIFLLRFKKD
ncbi:glycosyltransferase family 4 protein [Epilithonimonas arachidiradicis]|uniref:UDP-N-acetylmuramyl pentapeptide phosphotransferase/UDP-N-acetylglucosamine-1-phosphate transferase n=2 Tax=Epilithonimonas arachidiradicis TaxID=1617282 RepID=A0A420DDW3_9FLAO|nr:MraY family glycosyltransferase [Epilithonimonas arachidiradicis]RKE90118.1 UDP-N-acetylmuramyl pentapeptide phosphotransferase/UDP-N-acetylglucosamine-1-phosphate transferase [Epilithonimonas arachidiradicis]